MPKATKKNFYAVKAGRNPGIYLTWDECKQQVDSFPKAVYRGFEKRSEAEAFLGGLQVSRSNVADTSSKPSKPVSTPTTKSVDSSKTADDGIIPDCPTHSVPCIKLIVKKDGPNQGRPFWKCSQQDCNHFAWADRKIPPAKKKTQSKEKDVVVAEPVDPNRRFKIPSIPLNLRKDKQADHQSADAPSRYNYVNVYTDGSCIGNGKKGAIGGIGIYFGDDDPRNVSEPFLDGNPTNQRAEVKAAYVCLSRCVNDEEDVQIFTDSQYLINAVTDWRWGWEKNGWKASTGEPVKNEEIFSELFNIIDERSGGVRFTYVKGHKGIHGNEMADQLAVAGSKATPRNKSK